MDKMKLIKEIEENIKKRFIILGANKPDVCLPFNWIENEYRMNRDALELIPEAIKNLVSNKLITAAYKGFWIIRLTEKGVEWINRT